jgi:hypothetical protein
VNEFLIFAVGFVAGLLTAIVAAWAALRALSTMDRHED